MSTYPSDGTTSCNTHNMISNREISLNIIKACQNNEELNDFCINLYNKRLTYVRGLVLDVDEWSENQYQNTPLIIIDSLRRVNGEDHEYRIYKLNIMTLIVHSSDYFNKPVKDEVITYEGIDETEELHLLIIDALKQNDALTCLNFDTVDYYAEPVSYISNHTEYRGVIELTFSKENDFCIGNRW